MTALCPKMFFLTYTHTSRWWCACSLSSRHILGILQLDILACLTEPQANAKEYISRVEGCTAKIDESMKKWPMHLFRDSGLLFNIVKGPSASNVTQWSKYQQFYRRRHLVVRFHPTPTSKTGIVSYPLWEFQIIKIRYSKPHPKLCSHGRVLQREIIIYVHIPPLTLFGFDDLQFWICRLFAAIHILAPVFLNTCHNSSMCFFTNRKGLAVADTVYQI